MRGRLASRLMLHPVLLIALLILIVNDHVLKAAYPGWLTGKLSDFTGLVVFPLMLLSVLDLVLGALRRRSSVVVAVVLIGSGAVFAVIQINPAAAEAYRHFMGVIQYPLRRVFGEPSFSPVRHVADPWDLIALPALGAVWLVFQRGTRALRDVPGHNPVGT